MKDNVKAITRTIIATGLGIALFVLLFMYVKVPSPIPETSLQTAYGLGAFFAVVFGPLSGGLIAFIGHALSDAVQYGSPWWSWVIASGFCGAGYGIAYKKTNVSEGTFRGKDIALFNIIQLISNILAWVVIAPVFDLLIYKEPVNLAFTQGIVAAAMNSVTVAILGTLLLLAYSSTRKAKKER